MRLINADKLKIGISERAKTSSEASRFIDIIDRQTTEYDVDKVVERLMCESINCHIMTDRAIEIVKSGGVE